MESAKNSTCCYRASDSEIATNPEVYDCTTCELMSQMDALWQENAEAWQLYHLLCGRTVRDVQLEGWMLTKWTDGWPLDRVVELLDRLDLIAAVLEPHGRPEDQRHR